MIGFIHKLVSVPHSDQCSLNQHSAYLKYSQCQGKGVLCKLLNIEKILSWGDALSVVVGIELGLLSAKHALQPNRKVYK